MPKIVLEESGHRKIIEITGKVATVGRSTQNNICLCDQKSSRKHCNIIQVGNSWFVVDCESQNGTQVNNEYVQKKELKEGDVVAIGYAQLTFYPQEVPETVETTKTPEPVTSFGGADLKTMKVEKQARRKSAEPVSQPSADLEEEEDLIVEEDEDYSAKDAAPSAIAPPGEIPVAVASIHQEEREYTASLPMDAPGESSEEIIGVVEETPEDVASELEEAFLHPEEEQDEEPETIPTIAVPKNSAKEDTKKVEKIYNEFIRDMRLQEIRQGKLGELFFISMFTGAHCLLQGETSLVQEGLLHRVAQYFNLDYIHCNFHDKEQIAETQSHNIISSNYVNPDLLAGLLDSIPDNKTVKSSPPRVVVIPEKSLPEDRLEKLRRAHFVFSIPVAAMSLKEETELLKIVASPCTRKSSFSKQDYHSITKILDNLDVNSQVLQYTAHLIRATRSGTEESPRFVKEHVAQGAGSIMSYWLIKAGRVRAAMKGRNFVKCKDILAVSAHIVPATLRLTSSGKQTGSNQKIFQAIAASVPAPKES